MFFESITEFQEGYHWFWLGSVCTPILTRRHFNGACTVASTCDARRPFCNGKRWSIYVTRKFMRVCEKILAKNLKILFFNILAIYSGDKILILIYVATYFILWYSGKSTWNVLKRNSGNHILYKMKWDFAFTLFYVKFSTKCTKNYILPAVGIKWK